MGLLYLFIGRIFVRTFNSLLPFLFLFLPFFSILVFVAIFLLLVSALVLVAGLVL